MARSRTSFSSTPGWAAKSKSLIYLGSIKDRRQRRSAWDSTRSGGRWRVAILRSHNNVGGVRNMTPWRRCSESSWTPDEPGRWWVVIACRSAGRGVLGVHAHRSGRLAEHDPFLRGLVGPLVGVCGIGGDRMGCRGVADIHAVRDDVAHRRPVGVARLPAAAADWPRRPSRRWRSGSQQYCRSIGFTPTCMTCRSPGASTGLVVAVATAGMCVVWRIWSVPRRSRARWCVSAVGRHARRRSSVRSRSLRSWTTGPDSMPRVDAGSARCETGCCSPRCTKPGCSPGAGPCGGGLILAFVQLRGW